MQTLQPVVLQNKAPHWNEGLRCWCLNFRGRVKLASVKNFQVAGLSRVESSKGGIRVSIQTQCLAFARLVLTCTSHPHAS